ncbi:sporulation integral membrane protein YlbJ [Alicyclobacillus mali]|uniref:Sporulation integral membrane protein YlbJ n=1 Tax=Alicyclobacillus mali (ex Roth et al. 2021) TaxID=1123961 RepID=A0ABS0F2E9_9BACL|nr:sporulation integral membrane protein YlbJ [Alicyclobacillus mali (ex Roth et al. 2021)]MBF8377454.1 sporulation integral membrane protein YlbJ [Alicyclobacillus mali (ex Roth et al. 2021)]
MREERRGHRSTVLLAAMAVVFTLALVIYPKVGYEAGMQGLKVCWEIIIPSLLPFFIVSELLLGLGVVRGFGVLLEPLMQPLFSVPGVGAFALSMGLAAGYPMDAVITARFRQTKQCTRIEGERLLAFTNTADPLFMFGAVAVGMFKSPALGALFAVAHYISSFLVGVTFKLWGRRDPDHLREVKDREEVRPKGNLFARAYREMLVAREEDGRAFGKLLGNAVSESVQTILMISGFIVFFAVVIEILEVSGIMAVIGWPLMEIYRLFGIHTGLVQPTLAGVLELDIGSAQTAAVPAPLIQKLALVSGIIAWSGLSVHAQVASVLTQTDIRMRPYFLARFLHAALAALLTVLLYGMGVGRSSQGAMASLAHHLPVMSSAFEQNGFWPTFAHAMSNSVVWWAAIFAALVALSFGALLIRRIRVIAFFVRSHG